MKNLVNKLKESRNLELVMYQTSQHRLTPFHSDVYTDIKRCAVKNWRTSSELPAECSLSLLGVLNSR